jgi:hypothetical protein
MKSRMLGKLWPVSLELGALDPETVQLVDDRVRHLRF